VIVAKGLFLSLDGVDGTGKSTQCRLLADYLRSQGRTVTVCIDPGGTAIGNHIRQLLLDERQQMSVGCEMFLFMASRAQLVDEVIRPAVAAGQVVVSDRFLLANVVYQGHAGGLDPQRIWDIGQTATGGLLPDLTLVLDLPVEFALERRKATADRLESRDLDFHRRVRDGFLTEARLRPDRIRVVDAQPDIETVHKAICQAVLDL
jgi:dTMP kinase